MEAEAAPLELARRALERVAAEGDRAVVDETVAALIVRLHAGVDQIALRDTLEATFTLCRKLYSHASSAAAVPLARAALVAARTAGDPTLMRRAATACGVLLGDTGDTVGAMECYIDALRLAAAAEDREKMSGLWGNMGATASVAGSFELAARCYSRALALVEKDEGPVFSRFAACANLASACYKLGRLDEGLRYGERALLEMTPEICARDPYNTILLRRNLVRLFVASGRMAEARVHVEAAAREAFGGPPRMRIAAETARAVYEVALGQNDIALTRLDNAIAEARTAPAALQDALICAIRCEEASGNAARALLRLEELSDHVYRSNIEKAREHIRLAGMQDIEHFDGVQDHEQARARLISQLHPPHQPEGWKALQRLGVSAALPIDGTGWHGVRVGALTRALAQAVGTPAVQAREIGLAAELHDIGMTAVPAVILAKPGPLNGSERLVVQRHAQAGAEMLAEGRHPRMLLAQDIARYHHARFDGTGHPARVGGEFIPAAARMCAVADAYDMMVCGFGGRKPVSMGEALDELRRHAGGQFDPDLVECFDDVIRSEAGGRGMDLSSNTGMEDFKELVLSLKEDRGFA